VTFDLISKHAVHKSGYLAFSSLLVVSQVRNKKMGFTNQIKQKCWY